MLVFPAHRVCRSPGRTWLSVKQEVAAFYGAGIRCLTAVQQVGCMADDVKLHNYIRSKWMETFEVFAVQL